MMKFANQEKGKFLEVEPNEYFFIWPDFDCLTCFWCCLFLEIGWLEIVTIYFIWIDFRSRVNWILPHLTWFSHSWFFMKSSQFQTSSIGSTSFAFFWSRVSWILLHLAWFGDCLNQIDFNFSLLFLTWSYFASTPFSFFQD